MWIDAHHLYSLGNEDVDHPKAQGSRGDHPYVTGANHSTGTSRSDVALIMFSCHRCFPSPERARMAFRKCRRLPRNGCRPVVRFETHQRFISQGRPRLFRKVRFPHRVPIFETSHNSSTGSPSPYFGIRKTRQS